MINVKLDNKAKNTVAKTLNLGGGSLYTIQVKGKTDGRDPDNCSFTVQVDSKDIHTCQDLLNYLTEKGYYFNWTSGDGEGFILLATGQLGSSVITGIYTYSGEYVSMQNTSPDGASLDLKL